MSYKEMARRLAGLEQDAHARRRAWVDALSDAELDELCKDMPPEVDAAAQAMSDEELDRALDGLMPEAEWQQHLQHAKIRVRHL